MCWTIEGLIPLMSTIFHPVASLWSHGTFINNSFSTWFKLEAMMTRRACDGPKNTHLSVSSSCLSSKLGGTTVDGSGGVADVVRISDLNFHLSSIMIGIESCNAFISVISPSRSKLSSKYARHASSGSSQPLCGVKLLTRSCI